MANNSSNKGTKPRINYMWLWAVALGFILVWSFFGRDSKAPVVSEWNIVRDMIVAGDVDKIEVINGEDAEVYLKKESIDKYSSRSDFKGMPKEGVQLMYNIGNVSVLNDKLEKLTTENPEVEDLSVVYVTRKDVWTNILINLLPWVILIGFWIFMMRGMRGGGGSGGGIMNVGKARAQVFDKDNQVKVTFKDVAGLEEAKIEIMEIVDFLKNPQKYKNLGGKIPKGALLVGPPGTGKTLLAKAVAGEANVPFLSISGSDFVEMFVGVGASRVRDLFQQAKTKSPCIVFIDEIDAIGRARGKNAGFSGNDERENTLNQLLTEMDGFATNSGVIVLAATNRADILDKALMRAGRFDRQIDVGLPDVTEREAIFHVHLQKLKLAPDIDRQFLARQTAGFSGADIANVCNEAALIAARGSKANVSKEDFLSAIDRIVGGLEKKHKVMTPEDRRNTAFHEAGHATVSWFLENCDPVVKISIIPRGRSLGATWYLPEEKVTVRRETFMDDMAALLAGRVSEEVTFGTVCTGALNDLERATKMAYSMVAYYGMSDKIGNLSYYDSSGERDSFTKPFSEKTAQDMDTEVRRLIDEAYARAKMIIQQKQEGMKQLAELLLNKELIFSEDIERIFGKSARELAKERRATDSLNQEYTFTVPDVVVESGSLDQSSDF